MNAIRCAAVQGDDLPLVCQRLERQKRLELFELDRRHALRARRQLTVDAGFLEHNIPNFVPFRN